MTLVGSFLAALLLTLRIILPGAVFCAPAEPEEGSRLPRFRRSVTIFQVGLCLNILPALFLAPFSLWTPLADWSIWGLLVGVGFLRRLVSLKQKARGVGGIAVFLFLSSFFILLFPPRSEWLAGGWDPGIYQNNAIAIAGSSGLGGKTETVYNALSPEGLLLFSQTEGSYREVLPGVPVDEKTRKIPLYFFHLTPLLGAWVFRLAGLEGLLRLPMLLGVWMMPLIWRLFDVWSFKKLAVLGVGLWVLLPLWLYQLAIPTTEVLYLFLLTGCLIALSLTTETEKKRQAWLGLLMFLATVNHFNFPLVGGAVLLAFVWMNPRKEETLMKGMTLPGFAGLWAGVVWDLAFARVTLDRLQEKDQALTLVLAALGILTLASLWVSRFTFPDTLRKRLNRLLYGVFTGLGVGVMVLFLLRCNSFLTYRLLLASGSGGLITRMLHAASFCGIGHLIASGFGLIYLGRKGEEAPWALRAGVFGLVALLGLFMLNPGITPVYPWALRRYVAVAVPLLSVLSLYAFQILFTERLHPKNPWRVVTVLIIVAGFFASFPVSRAAAKVGDYRGISTWITEIMAGIEPRDVVVADDPRWGTPLFLSQGVDVLNGKAIWDSEDPEKRARAYAELFRLQTEEKRRILWLTSTPSAMGHYPDSLQIRQIILENVHLTYPVVIHSPRADQFATQTLSKSFGLYEVEIPSPALPTP